MYSWDILFFARFRPQRNYFMLLNIHLVYFKESSMNVNVNKQNVRRQMSMEMKFYALVLDVVCPPSLQQPT